MDTLIAKRSGKKKRKQWHVSPPAKEMQKILALGSNETRRLSLAGLKMNKKFNFLIRERLSSHEDPLISSVTLLDITLQPSLASVEVVWLGSGDAKRDEATQAALNGIRTELRGALIFESGSRRPAVSFVRDLRPFYTDQVDSLLESCSNEAVRTAAAEEEAEMVERQLEALYPYHARMRARRAEREARWAERDQASQAGARLSRRLRATPGVKPKGLEPNEEDEVYGVPYRKLRQLVLSSVGKADRREDEEEEGGLEMGALFEEEKPALGAHEIRRLTAEARMKALKEMKGLREVWRKERKSRKFEFEEEEEEWRKANLGEKRRT